jgi:deoxyadenosine/deoxycytidine kinase
MIAAFDGNVFTGKTSLIGAVHSLLDSNIIGEQGSFLTPNVNFLEPNTMENACYLQRAYLRAEERRAPLAIKGVLNLLDRSFVSMAAHVSALKAARSIDIQDWFFDELVKLMSADKIIVPDVFCFVRCDFDLANSRARNDRSRNTGRLYLEKTYFHAVEDFNSAWSKKFPSVMVDTSKVLPIRLAEGILDEMPRAVAKDDASTKQICEFLLEIKNH